MKKFLLVVFVGMAVAMNLYGIVNEYLINNEIEEANHIEETTTTVYLE